MLYKDILVQHAVLLQTGQSDQGKRRCLFDKIHPRRGTIVKRVSSEQRERWLERKRDNYRHRKVDLERKRERCG
jgi:hypothetical protein